MIKCIAPWVACKLSWRLCNLKGVFGKPKGVMLSHGGILSNCEGAREILEFLTKDDNPIFICNKDVVFDFENESKAYHVQFEIDGLNSDKSFSIFSKITLFDHFHLFRSKNGLPKSSWIVIKIHISRNQIFKPDKILGK